MKSSSKTDNINLNFTDEMVSHHEGAVQMCYNVLRYSIDPRLRVIAQNIIKKQTQGINLLEDIRRTIQHP